MDADLIDMTGSQKRPLEEEEGDNERQVKRVKSYNDHSIIELDIGNNCHVYAQKYVKTGDMYVHIRYYDTSPTGKQYPSKKGIALSLDKFKRLYEEYIDEIDVALRKLEEKTEDRVFFKKHLGENIYVKVEKGYDLVDIRKWWLPDTSMDIHPTKKGISLQLGMWEEFKKTLPVLKRKLKKELDEVRYCEYDHDNQMAMWQCHSCNPNDWMNH
jgi:hypothetical protein